MKRNFIDNKSKTNKCSLISEVRDRKKFGKCAWGI